MNDYANAIQNYISNEYSDYNLLSMNDSQSKTVAGLMSYCYSNNDSVNNAAGCIVDIVKATSGVKNDA